MGHTTSSTKQKADKQDKVERALLLLVGDVEQFKKDYMPLNTFVSDAISTEGYFFVHANISHEQIPRLRKDKNIKQYEFATSMTAL